jgi:hypothetical protein
MTLKYPSIPEPTTTPEGLRDVAVATKQAIEILVGARGKNKLNAAVTWQDLVDKGLILPSQVPLK